MARLKSSKLCGIRITAFKAIFISVGMAQAIVFDAVS
jgi:hypothetical protein